MSSSRGRLDRLHPVLPWAVVGLAGTFALRRLDDSDTWWHLASGRWIAEHATVPATDTLSYTATDHAWINLQWLQDLALYVLYGFGGASALVWASAATYTAAFALMVAHLRRSLGPIATALVALWVLLVCQDRFTIRPEMLSFLLLQGVLWLLATARADDGRRLWLLVPLMLLWVNLHGLFVIGLFAIGCAVVAALLSGSDALAPRARRRLWLAAATSAAATVANPYLLRGVLFPLELLTRFGHSSPYGSIGEFRSPFAAFLPDLTLGAFQLLFAFAWVIVTAAAMVSVFGARGAVRGATPFDLAGLLFFVGLAALAAIAYRNVALFAMGTAPFLGRCLTLLGPSLGRARPRWAPNAARLVAAGLAIVLGIGGWLVASNRYYRWDARTHEFGSGILEVSFPMRAAEFFEQAQLPGPLYNDLTAGGYLTWARPNGERVYIDSRLEVYDEFFTEYSAGLREPSMWAQQAERYGIASVVLFHGWSNRHPLIGWLNHNPDWSLVYFDEVAVLFVRTHGHEAVVARARAAFQERYEATIRRLLEPPRQWGYPVGRVAAWTALGRLFETLGDSTRAAEAYGAVLDYDLPASDVLSFALWLADHFRAAGDLPRARRYLDRARTIDAEDLRVARLTEAL